MKRQVISRVQRCALLLVICGIGFQQLQASKFGGEPAKVKATEGKDVKADVAKETAAKKAQEQQTGRMARLRSEAARSEGAARGQAAEVGGKSAQEFVDGKMSELSTPKLNLVNGTADAVSFLVTKVAQGVNRVTPKIIRQKLQSVIAEPVMKTWLQMRQLEVTNLGDKGIDLKNYSKNELASKAPSKEEVGLMNQKIDIIVDSLVNMYDKGLSIQEMGTFAKNAVQLTLYAGVIGMGAGAGGAIGAAHGAITGAGKSMYNLWGGNSSKSSGGSVGSSHLGFTSGFMVGSGGGGGDAMGVILMVLAVPIVATAFVATGVTAGVGAYGGVKGAVKSTPGGMRAGARYTSKALQSPKDAAKMMWNDMRSGSRQNQTNAANLNASVAQAPAGQSAAQ